MLTSTIVISGLVVLSTGGLFVYSKFKNKKNEIEKEIVTPYTRPAQERIKFSKVNDNIKSTPTSTSSIKQKITPSRSSNTIRSHNTYDDNFYPTCHDYGSNSHSSSHDSHSSHDSGGSYDSGSCDCGGCD